MVSGSPKAQNVLPPRRGGARSFAVTRWVGRHATSFVICSVPPKAVCNLLIRVWSAMPGSQSF